MVKPNYLKKKSTYRNTQNQLGINFVLQTRLIVSSGVCRFPRVKFMISKIIFQKRFPLSKSFVNNQYLDSLLNEGSKLRGVYCILAFAEPSQNNK